MSCVVCDDKWKNRKGKVHASGAKEVPMTFHCSLLSKFGKQRIKLLFCDLHVNNLRAVTKYTNKGILRIRNLKKMSWVNADKVGVVLK